MIFFIKENKLKKYYAQYLEEEGTANNISFEELISVMPYGSDAVLPYIIVEYVRDEDIIAIDINKNIEEQLKENNITFREFALYVTFYNTNKCNELDKLEEKWSIAEAIVLSNLNKLSVN